MRQGFELAGNAVVIFVRSVAGNELKTFCVSVGKRPDACFADMT